MKGKFKFMNSFIKRCTGKKKSESIYHYHLKHKKSKVSTEQLEKKLDNIIESSLDQLYNKMNLTRDDNNAMTMSIMLLLEYDREHNGSRGMNNLLLRLASKIDKVLLVNVKGPVSNVLLLANLVQLKSNLSQYFKKELRNCSVDILLNEMIYVVFTRVTEACMLNLEYLCRAIFSTVNKDEWYKNPVNDTSLTGDNIDYFYNIGVQLKEEKKQPVVADLFTYLNATMNVCVCAEMGTMMLVQLFHRIFLYINNYTLHHIFKLAQNVDDRYKFNSTMYFNRLDMSLIEYVYIALQRLRDWSETHGLEEGWDQKFMPTCVTLDVLSVKEYSMYLELRQKVREAGLTLCENPKSLLQMLCKVLKLNGHISEPWGTMLCREKEFGRCELEENPTTEFLAAKNVLADYMMVEYTEEDCIEELQKINKDSFVYRLESWLSLDSKKKGLVVVFEKDSSMDSEKSEVSLDRGSLNGMEEKNEKGKETGPESVTRITFTSNEKSENATAANGEKKLGICRSIRHQSSSTHSSAKEISFHKNQLSPRKEESPMKKIIVVLNKTNKNQSVGLNIKAAKNRKSLYQGIYVTSVVKGSLAHKSGKLDVGDQLIELNGETLVNVDREKAVEMINACPRVLRFDVLKQSAQLQGLLDRILDDDNSRPGEGIRVSNSDNKNGTIKTRTSETGQKSSQKTGPRSAGSFDIVENLTSRINEIETVDSPQEISVDGISAPGLGDVDKYMQACGLFKNNDNQQCHSLKKTSTLKNKLSNSARKGQSRLVDANENIKRSKNVGSKKETNNSEKVIQNNEKQETGSEQSVHEKVIENEIKKYPLQKVLNSQIHRRLSDLSNADGNVKNIFNLRHVENTSEKDLEKAASKAPVTNETKQKNEPELKTRKSDANQKTSNDKFNTEPANDNLKRRETNELAKKILGTNAFRPALPKINFLDGKLQISQPSDNNFRFKLKTSPNTISIPERLENVKNIKNNQNIAAASENVIRNVTTEQNHLAVAYNVKTESSETIDAPLVGNIEPPPPNVVSSRKEIEDEERRNGQRADTDWGDDGVDQRSSEGTEKIKATKVDLKTLISKIYVYDKQLKDDVNAAVTQKFAKARGGE